MTPAQILETLQGLEPQVAALVTALNPQAAGSVAIIGGLLQTGSKLYANLQAIAAQTEATAPDVWAKVVAANEAADARFAASGPDQKPA